MTFTRSLVLGLALVSTLTICSVVRAQDVASYPVKQVQQALNDAGFNTGVPDGVWGKKSGKALRAFQKARGLAVTGVVDSDTRGTLFPLQESIRKNLERKTTDSAVPDGDIPAPPDISAEDTIKVTPAERKALGAPAALPLEGVDVDTLRLVNLLRIADFGVGTCHPDTLDTDEISKRLFGKLGADRFAMVYDDIRKKIGDFAIGYPTRDTDFSTRTCGEWEDLAAKQGLTSVAQPTPRDVQPQPEISISSEDPKSATEASTRSGDGGAGAKFLKTLLAVGGVIFLIWLFKSRKRAKNAAVPPQIKDDVAFPLTQKSPVTLAARPVTAQSIGVTTLRPNASEPSRSDVSWIPKGHPANIDNRPISGGFIYVGTTLKKQKDNWANENCLINPKLEVAKGRADISGQHMTYWPSYSEIAPTSRKAYLDWLQGPRNDPETYIGYVFLYFYGLERRLLLDPGCNDADAVVEEVRRLLGIYETNGSFRRYASALLDAYAVQSNGFDDAGQLEFEQTGGEVPLALRVALGMRAKDGRPVEPNMLLAYTMSHPETRVRTPARRALGILKGLFAAEVRKVFVNGVFFKTNVRHGDLSMNYSSASGSFDVAIQPANLRIPDVMSLEQPLANARAILERCTEMLDAYSREIGKSEGLKPTLSAVAKLPAGLRREQAALLKNNPIQILERYSQSAAAVFVPRLASELGYDDLAGGGRAKLVQFANSLAALGFGITLDPTYALRSGKADDLTLVFKLDDLMTDSRAASDVFVRTKMLLHLGMIIANADGVIDSTERDRLKIIIENTSGLSMDERRRLTSDLRGLETDAGALTDWTKRLKAAPIEQRQELGDQLVKIAQADGTVEKGEVVQLEKLFKLMELGQQSLYQSLHMASAATAVVSRDDDIPIIIPAGPEFGYAIPERPASPSIPASRIDLAKLAAIRNETMGTVSILDEIFREEEVIDASAIVSATPVDTGEDAADSLDGRHRGLLLEILARQQWSRPEFDGLVKQVGLMPSAVMETLNHWSLEKFEDLVLEGDDPIYPNIELIPPDAFGAAA